MATSKTFIAAGCLLYKLEQAEYSYSEIENAAVQLRANDRGDSEFS